MSDEMIGSAILRLTQERAQARLDLKRIETLIQELVECFERLGASLNPTRVTENPEWVISNVDAELAVYLNIEKLRDLLKNKAALQATISKCTSKINGYTGD